MREIEIEKFKEVASSVAKQHALLLMILFGSQATGQTHRQSDVDIAVLADRLLSINELIKIGYELEKVVRLGPIEMVDLKSAPPLLLKAVATEGKLLYECRSQLFAEFQIRALRRYFDTKPLRKLQEESLRAYLQTV